MNLYFRYVALLSGVLNTGRTVAVIGDQIPPDLEDPQEAAAWVSYALRPHRADLGPLPDWFIEGERHWDLVPPALEAREAEERRRAFIASPRCYIDRGYARPLRRNLLKEFPWLSGETEMTFSFDGRVLSIVLNESVHEVAASGDSWTSSYSAVVSPETKSPPRFESRAVEVQRFRGLCEF